MYETTTIRNRSFPSLHPGIHCAPLQSISPSITSPRHPLMCFLSLKINLHFYISLHFLKFYINIIIQYDSYFFYLPSLTIMYLRFIILLHVSVVYSFVLLSIPLYRSTTLYLSLHLLRFMFCFPTFFSPSPFLSGNVLCLREEFEVNGLTVFSKSFL